MHEIARVTLQNEMDLILAHKRSMKLGELAGLSLSAQTSFATAVSEVARNTIDNGKSGCLILQVEADQWEKYIIASITDEETDDHQSRGGLVYAKRLVNKYHITTKGSETSIHLYYAIAPPFKIDIHKLDEWRSLFRNEPPVSAYDEIKRKNQQLEELSEKVQKSEAQYKTLTNSLPLIIFSLNLESQLVYANEWLTRYTGETLDGLNNSQWRSVIHADDYTSFSLLLKTDITKGATTLRTQSRIRNITSDTYLWHQVSLSPFNNEKGELQYWIGYIVDIHAQKVFEETLKDNIELKQTQGQLKENQEILEQYIAELNRSNQELQQFAYVASHDLQEPVRKMLYYSDYLISKYTGSIDPKGLEYLQNMQAASHRMRNLIQDLLVFSQVNKEKTHFDKVDLNNVLEVAQQDLEIAIEEKRAQLHIEPLPVIQGDQRMLCQLFENLITNALKYSKTAEAPVIEITTQQKEGFHIIAVKDNGIGFDDKYLPQMFTLFQRLHDRDSFEGTGLGLAICRKIVDLHQGEIYAEGKEGEGSTFFVSLPIIA
jgi:PAS domain S-box-containing protein